MKRIDKNFMVVSQYNGDLSWVTEYSNSYMVYDRSDNPAYPPQIDLQKVVTSPNLGYNFYDYFRFIVDNYDNMPECVIFVKANIFQRHISKEYFDRVMNNDWFTPLTDYRLHREKWPYGFFSPEGLLCELNTDAFLSQERPTKYFHSYNDFLKFCFKDPIIPRYRMFAPGGNYIVPRANILKLPKVVYENLKLIISHHPHCGEAHMVERAIISLWCGNFELNEKILKPIDESTFVPIPKAPENRSLVDKVKDRIRNKAYEIIK